MQGYAISWVIRKRIEQGFGWTKTIGGLRKLTRIGLQKVRAWTAWSVAGCNLIRMGGIKGWWQPSPTSREMRVMRENHRDSASDVGLRSLMRFD